MPALAPTAQAAVDRLAYSPAEAAKALGISRSKLYQKLDDGTIPSIKLDGRRLIRVADLVALLDALGEAA
jgi:excisionase family DNA binding protein